MEVFVKKKTKILTMLLAMVFVVALGTGTVLANGGANSSGMMTAVAIDKGGAVPADIVSGLIANPKAQIQAQAGHQVAIITATSAGTSVETVNRTDAPTETMPSSIVGTQPKGSGGDLYHAGKILASVIGNDTPNAATVAAGSGGSPISVENVVASSQSFRIDDTQVGGSSVT